MNRRLEDACRAVGRWMPGPLWAIWRDLTWCRESRRGWLAKMHRYHRGPNPKFAIWRAQLLLEGSALDWDENVPQEWAKTFLCQIGRKT